MDVNAGVMTGLAVGGVLGIIAAEGVDVGMLGIIVAEGVDVGMLGIITGAGVGDIESVPAFATVTIDARFRTRRDSAHFNNIAFS